MKKSKLRISIENIRFRISNRIEVLTKYEKEYKVEERFESAESCRIKAAQLFLVLIDLDKSLAIEGEFFCSDDII